MAKLSDFALTDEKNEFFKPDLDINIAFEKLANSSEFLSLVEAYFTPISRTGFANEEEYNEAVEQRKKDGEAQLEDFFEIMNKGLLDMLKNAGRLRTENPASATGGGIPVPSGTST